MAAKRRKERKMEKELKMAKSMEEKKRLELSRKAHSKERTRARTFTSAQNRRSSKTAPVATSCSSPLSVEYSPWVVSFTENRQFPSDVEFDPGNKVRTPWPPTQARYYSLSTALQSTSRPLQLCGDPLRGMKLKLKLKLKLEMKKRKSPGCLKSLPGLFLTSRMLGKNSTVS